MKIMNFIDDIIGIIITVSILFLNVVFIWQLRRQQFRDLYSIKDFNERGKMKLIYNGITITAIIIAALMLSLLSYLVTDLVEFLF